MRNAWMAAILLAPLPACRGTLPNPLPLRGGADFIWETTRDTLRHHFDRIDSEDRERGVILSDYRYLTIQGIPIRSFALATITPSEEGSRVEVVMMDEVLRDVKTNPVWGTYGRNRGVEQLMLREIDALVRRGPTPRPEERSGGGG